MLNEVRAVCAYRHCERLTSTRFSACLAGKLQSAFDRFAFEVVEADVDGNKGSRWI